MQKKTLNIRLYPDGRIETETHGVKGKQCLKYMALLEEILQAQIIDSEFTKEYYETEETVNYQVQSELEGQA